MNYEAAWAVVNNVSIDYTLHFFFICQVYLEMVLDTQYRFGLLLSITLLKMIIGVI